jgi:Co/Zn/Cd efflux system component
MWCEPVQNVGALLYIPNMNANCCHHCHADDPHRDNPAYRRTLWIVLAINALMFGVEIGLGLAAGSASLQADALDFWAMQGTTPSACS